MAPSEHVLLLGLGLIILVSVGVFLARRATRPKRDRTFRVPQGPSMHSSGSTTSGFENVKTSLGALFVTDSRVREQTGSGLKSAYLHEVNAGGIRRTHYPWLLLIAFAGIGLGMLGRMLDSAASLPGLFIAVVCVIAYLMTRRVNLDVVAGQMVMSTTLSGSEMEAAEDFVESLEDAKRAWEAHHATHGPAPQADPPPPASPEELRWSPSS